MNGQPGENVTLQAHLDAIANCLFEVEKREFLSVQGSKIIQIIVPADLIARGFTIDHIIETELERETSAAQLSKVGIENETANTADQVLSGLEPTADGHRLTVTFQKRKAL